MSILCPWIRLTRAIKLVRILISERAQISNYLTPPPERYSTATTRSIHSTTCWKVGRCRITELSPTPYTYSSLSTVYRKYNRREYRPVRNPLSLTSFEPRTPIPTTPSSNTQPLLDPLRRPLTLLRTT